MTGPWTWTSWLQLGLLMLLHHRPSVSKGDTDDVPPPTSPSIHLSLPTTVQGDGNDGWSRAEPWSLTGATPSPHDPPGHEPPSPHSPNPSSSASMAPDYRPLGAVNQTEADRTHLIEGWAEGNLTLSPYSFPINSSGHVFSNETRSTNNHGTDQDNVDNKTQEDFAESSRVELNLTEHIGSIGNVSQHHTSEIRTNITDQDVDYDSDEYYFDDYDDNEDNGDDDDDEYYYKYDSFNKLGSPNDYADNVDSEDAQDYYYDGDAYYGPEEVAAVDTDNSTEDEARSGNVTDDSAMDSDEGTDYYDSNPSDDPWMGNTGQGHILGSEIFYGPGAHENLLGPEEKLKLKKGEPVEIHPSFLDQNSSESSLGILVFYTWIGVVTIIIIGAFIALKHRHRIATYVWDSRSGYRKETVFATEEGRNLLNHQQT